MIFVTIGTFEMQFNRLLEAIEYSNIADEVIIQCGYTKFESNKYKVIPFLEGNEFDYYIKNADIVISHGGVGSILNALKNNKKVIAVPRLGKYNEHVDDHQLEIVQKFTDEGYVLGYFEGNNITEVLKKAKTFEPRIYKFNNSKLLNFLDNYLKSL